MPAAYQRFSLAQIKALAASRVGAINFWYEDEFVNSINEAISVWAAMTGYWTSTFPLGITAGTAFYAVPAQITSVKRVTYLGQPLSQMSTPELDLAGGDWETQVGTPVYWAPEGINLIAINPTTTGTIVLEGIGEAPWLSADGDWLDIGDDDLNALLEYVHHYLTFKEGGQEFEASAADFQSFLKQAVSRNSKLRATTFYRKYMGLDHEAEQRRDSTPSNPGARS